MLVNTDLSGPTQIPRVSVVNADGSQYDPVPWRIDIDVYHTASANTNFATVNADPGSPYGGYLSSTGTINAEVTWADIVLSSGTWTIELIHLKTVNAGIYTVSIDGSAVGTIDGHAASLSYGNKSTVTGITISSTGRHTLNLKMATKNASSANYQALLEHIQLRRTA